MLSSGPSSFLALAALVALAACDEGVGDRGSTPSTRSAAAANVTSPEPGACAGSSGEAAANCQQGVGTLKAVGSVLTRGTASSPAGSTAAPSGRTPSQ